MAQKTPKTKPDASLDPILNGVKLPTGDVVAWAVAFPRDFDAYLGRRTA